MKKSPSSICSAESAGSALDLREPGLFGQLPSVSKTPTPSVSSKSTGLKSQSLKMSEPSQQMDLEGSTSSVAGSPASPGVSPGSKEAQKMTVTSGQRWLPLLKTYGLSGSLAKTCAALLVSQWASSAVYLTWRGLGTKPSHLLFQLAPSTPRTEGTGSGLWQTPNANEDRAERYALETSYRHRQEGRQIHLAQEVRDQRLWPTPSAQEPGWKNIEVVDKNGNPPTHHNQRFYDKKTGRIVQKGLQQIVEMWPTPKSCDWKGSGTSKKAIQREAAKSNLWGKVGEHTGGGSLNPTWVEWLMGFPAGWTNLTSQESQQELKTVSPDSNVSETPSCRKSSSKSDGQSSQDGSDER